MKLVTKEIERRVKQYPLYSQDGKKKDAVAVAKFFLPISSWTWYMLEADLQEGIAFGIVINGSGEGEYGYFSLNELQDMKVTKFQLTVERDIYFEPTKLSDIENEYLQKFLDRMYS